VTPQARFFELARKDGKSIHAWTLDEIMAQGQFGMKQGWFYGMVVEDGEERLAEMFPGIGYSIQDPTELDKDGFVRAMGDLWLVKPKYTGQEAALRAAAQRARLDQGKTEYDERMLAATVCPCTNRRQLGMGTSWCRDCWRFFQANEPKELPEGRWSVMMPPEIADLLA